MRWFNRWVLCLAVGLLAGACGGPGGAATSDLHLAIEARSLPPAATSITCYIVDNDAAGAACAELLGDAAPDEIGDHSANFVGSPRSQSIDPNADINLVLRALPPKELLFYLEARDGSLNTVACGCGIGVIEIGKKTPIPIFLVEDCK